MGMAAALTTLVCGCNVAGQVNAPLTPPPTPGEGSALPAGTTLSVQGSHLLRLGVPFVPRGVTIVGFEAPYQSLRGTYLDARDGFGPAELTAARGFGADTVRFVVGQRALTPPYGDGGTQFRRSLLDAVQSARSLGFVVIVALDGSVISGEPADQPLPTTNTLHTWEQLAPMFSRDQGVALELYDAPAARASPANWQVWAHGGDVDPGGSPAVGMQQLIDGIRHSGSSNVVIADGLDHGHTLANAPPLDDPAGALVYGVEPYPHAGDGDASWTSDFGRFAQDHPVLATEWDAPSVPPPLSSIPQTCDPSTPQTAQTLLDYLAVHRIGVVGYAFDLPGTLVRDLTAAQTSYDSLVCGQPGQGPGQLLSAVFRRG